MRLLLVSLFLAVKTVPALALAEKPVYVFEGYGFTVSDIPADLKTTFILSKEERVATVVVVSNVFEASESPAALLAHLFGTRFADKSWLRSVMTAGTCFQFQDVVGKRGYCFYITEGFRAEHPTHTAVMETAHNASIRGDHRFRAVVSNELPAIIKNPLLTFLLIDSARPEKGKHDFRLPDLFHLLSERAQQCR